MKNIISCFVQGLLYLVPLVVTAYVVYIAVSYTDSLISGIGLDSIAFPGLGLIVIVCLITGVGYFVPMLLTTSTSNLVKHLINKIPLVRVIYSSAQDLMKALVGKERKFSTPVLVSLDNDEVMHRLGFITSADLSRLDIEGMIAVYLPNSYGLLGDLVIVPKSKIKKLDVNSADVMKFIVSGGVTSIEEAEKKRTANEQ